jgi:signal transduction histidine kinase
MSETKTGGSERLFSSSRFALGAGFGGLLAIMALGGIYGLQVLQKIRVNDNQIRKQFLSKNHTLNDIRSQLHLSGVIVRDYLLDPEPGHAETYRASLQEVRRQMESAFASFRQQLEPDQTKYSVELSTELSNYWEVLGPIFMWDAEGRRRKGYAFLQDVVLPRRSAVAAIAGQIADFNERQLDEGNRQVDHLLAEFQRRMAMSLVVALLLGTAMAGFSIWKILRLERRAQIQYLEVAEARRQLKQLSARLVQAQEDERRGLSRDLHDEVGQALSAVLVELRNLSAESAIRSDAQSAGHVETVRSLVENSVRVVRNMALLLRPSMLDDLGLVPALRWQAREVSKRTSMEVSVAAELASDDLPDNYKTCIYRVVQEALHNCSGHAHATRVQIRVQQQPRRLALSIQDDGQGFDVRQTKGLGLLGIEERVARLGGKCDIHSEPGSGTIVAIELPFENGKGGGGDRGQETDSDTLGG